MWHVGDGRHGDRWHDNHGKGQQAGGTTTARAADHGDRSHRLSYDGSFDNVLVSKTRAEGCLVFLRKVNPSGRGSLFDARHEYQSSVGFSPSPSGWYASASSSLSPKRRGESVL